jgi:tRNA G37 N-methylase TrmD
MDFLPLTLEDRDQEMTENDKIASIGQVILGSGEIIMVLLDDDVSEAIVGIMMEE